MPRTLGHEALIRRGLDLHEARRYGAALPCFVRAIELCPACPVAEYNRASTLHMLDRDADAEQLLRQFLARPAEFRGACRVRRPRSLRLDAHYLLFLVLIHGRGYSAEAFASADRHLSERRRGLLSVWPTREVRAEVAAHRRAWAEGTAAGTGEDRAVRR